MSVTTGEINFNNPALAGLNLANYTTVERDALASPFGGQAIFNTTTNKVDFYDGTTWVELTTGTGGGFPATFVGPGEAFTTVGAALTGGFSNLFLTGDVIETGDISQNAFQGVNIVLGDAVTWDLDAFEFSTSLVGSTLRISSQGNASLSYSRSSGRPFVGSGGPVFSNLIIIGVNIDNSSTGVATYLSQDNNLFLYTCEFKVPNQISAGIQQSGDERLSVERVNFIGGGAGCSNVVGGEKGVLQNIEFTGTYFPGGNLISTGDQMQFSDILIDTASNCSWLGTYLTTGLISVGSGSVSVVINNTGSITNVTLANGDLRIANAAQDTLVSNFRSLNGSLQITANFGNKLVNCDFGNGSHIVNSDLHTFTNCSFDTGLSVAGDNCGFSNCRFGPAGGGGSGSTLTIQVSAFQTRVAMCTSDSAIIDNSASSLIDPNTNSVY